MDYSVWVLSEISNYIFNILGASFPINPSLRKREWNGERCGNERITVYKDKTT